MESDKERSVRTPVTLLVDSKPAYYHLQGQVLTIKDKRLAIEMLLMKQDVERENVAVKWIPTEQMLVDGLTKIGAPLQLLRRVMKEGRITIVENDEMKR